MLDHVRDRAVAQGLDALDRVAVPAVPADEMAKHRPGIEPDDGAAKLDVPAARLRQAGSDRGPAPCAAGSAAMLQIRRSSARGSRIRAPARRVSFSAPTPPCRA